MPRHEFSTKTKRAAHARSGGLCEAIGAVYGLPTGQRCNMPLNRGVEYDHYPVPATERDSDGLENCVACCRACHAHKTATFDIPVHAKVKRRSDREAGIRPKPRLSGPGFRKSPPQNTATSPRSKRVGQFGDTV